MYQIGNLVGKGATASVFSGLNLETGETVAIKQFQIENLCPRDLASIKDEIDLLKQLKHKNIVSYYGFIEAEGCLNVIMEYCENGSLQNVVKRFGQGLTLDVVSNYVYQILEGLVYLHSQGVIHGDIKCWNF